MRHAERQRQAGAPLGWSNAGLLLSSPLFLTLCPPIGLQVEEITKTLEEKAPFALEATVGSLLFMNGAVMDSNMERS